MTIVLSISPSEDLSILDIRHKLAPNSDRNESSRGETERYWLLARVGSEEGS